MPPYKTIGSLFEHAPNNEGQDPYWTGIVTVGGLKHRITIYKNKGKQFAPEPTRAPDYIIYAKGR